MSTQRRAGCRLPGLLGRDPPELRVGCQNDAPDPFRSGFSEFGGTREESRPGCPHVVDQQTYLGNPIGHCAPEVDSSHEVGTTPFSREGLLGETSIAEQGTDYRSLLSIGEPIRKAAYGAEPSRPPGSRPIGNRNNDGAGGNAARRVRHRR